MASNKPPLHGHDHLPGHIDPIPGLKELITTTVGASIMPTYCYYNSATGTPVTAAAGSGGYVSWSPDGGDTSLLDVSGGTSAVVTVRGVYSVAVTFASTSTGWTVGSTYGAWVTANTSVGGLDLQQMRSVVTVGEHDLPAGGDLFTGYGTVNLADVPMEIGDQFQVLLANNDDSTHDLVTDQIWVTRIYAY